ELELGCRADLRDPERSHRGWRHVTDGLAFDAPGPRVSSRKAARAHAEWSHSLPSSRQASAGEARLRYPGFARVDRAFAAAVRADRAGGQAQLTGTGGVRSCSLRTDAPVVPVPQVSADGLGRGGMAGE